ncbi:MAG: hypothetical protein K1X72_21245 [Pyrinomonadaceae bacterium]|nr:hypothetical protein [Pyrinomonadaceae bacterium]
MENLKIKKLFLYTLIGSIAVSAVLGIWAIISGEFGDFQARILMTTMTVVGTSILGLACGAFLESEKSAKLRLKIVPVAGIFFAIIAAFLALLLIWQIVSSTNETVEKTIAVSGIFAFSLAQLSLLSLANLSAKFQGALICVYLATLSLASIISILIIIEPSRENDFVFRLLGVLGIVDAALTVLIPIFHRLSRGDFSANQPEIEKIDAEIAKLKEELERLEQQREEILNKK